MKKSKEISAGFTVTPHTAKVTATVCDTYLVEMGKALHLWTEENEWKTCSS